MLGYVSLILANNSQNVEMYAALLSPVLRAKSAYGRAAVALIISTWARGSQESDVASHPPPPSLVSQLIAALGDALYFDEIGLLFTRIQKQVNTVIPPPPSGVLTLPAYQKLLEGLKESAEDNEDMRERIAALQADVATAIREQDYLSLLSEGCLAEALVSTRAIAELPKDKKVGTIIRPLMAGVKKQSEHILQDRFACALAELILQCSTLSPCPNPKIMVNLVSCLVSDHSFVPTTPVETDVILAVLCESETSAVSCDMKEGKRGRKMVGKQNGTGDAVKTEPYQPNVTAPGDGEKNESNEEQKRQRKGVSLVLKVSRFTATFCFPFLLLISSTVDEISAETVFRQ